MLEQLATPAQITSDLGVTLAQNPLAEALVGVQTQHTGLRRSLIYRWFTDPAERRIHPEDDQPLHSRIWVASLRAVHGRAPEDAEARELVDHLLRESDEFAALWERHEVARPDGKLKRFVHPLVGGGTRPPLSDPHLRAQRHRAARRVHRGPGLRGCSAARAAVGDRVAGLLPRPRTGNAVT